MCHSFKVVLGGIVRSILFRVDFVLWWVGSELLRAIEMRGGGKLQLVVNPRVVKTFLVLYASRVCWGWVDKVDIGWVDWLQERYSGRDEWLEGGWGERDGRLGDR